MLVHPRLFALRLTEVSLEFSDLENCVQGLLCHVLLQQLGSLLCYGVCKFSDVQRLAPVRLQGGSR